MKGRRSTFSIALALLLVLLVCAWLAPLQVLQQHHWTQRTAQETISRITARHLAVSDDPIWLEKLWRPPRQDKSDAASSRALMSMEGKDSYNWILKTAHAPFAARYAHTAVLNRRQEIFVMGGATSEIEHHAHGGHTDEHAQSGYQNDVWLSLDQGISWGLVTPRSDRFRKRRGHASVTNANAVVIFLLGGFCGKDCFMRDWWSSENGEVWNNMGNAAWSARHGHSAIITSKETLILLGGHDGQNYLNDVWSIQDPAQALSGVGWQLVTSAAEWSPRYGHGIIVDSVDTIILMGGFFANKKSGIINCFNDVWRSVDNGRSWVLLVERAPWSGRYQHSTVITQDDDVFVVGGLDEDLARCGDVWRSKDSGQSWDVVTPAAPWAARYEHAVVADMNGSLYIIGGLSTGMDKYNDVWRSERTCVDDVQCPDETLCRDGSNDNFIGIPGPLCIGLCDRKIFDNCAKKEACRVADNDAECFNPCDEMECEKGEVCQVAERDDWWKGELLLEAEAKCLACADSKTKFACDPLKQCEWDSSKEVCQMRCNVLKDSASCKELTYCKFDKKACTAKR